MPRYPQPYKRKGSPYYAFKYTDAAGARRTKSTGCRKKSDAEAMIRRFIDRLDEPEAAPSPTFREYARPFFTADCPHVRRLRESGKNIGEDYIRAARSYLDRYVEPDPFADMPIDEIRRRDLVDFRNRLVDAYGARNFINKVLGAVKVVLSEAEYREDVDRNAGARVGNIRHDRRDRDVLSLEELRELFRDPPGHFCDDLGWRVFRFAATTGMRSGEVRALTWRQIDGEYCDVDRAWKAGGKVVGLPKWEKTRHIVLPRVAREALPPRGADGALVFAYPDGSPLGERWYHRRWYNALSSLGIARREWDPGKRKHYYETIDGRNLPPHAARHTINTLAREAGAENLRADVFFGWRRVDEQAAALSAMARNYTHWKHEATRQVADTIDEIFS